MPDDHTPPPTPPVAHFPDDTAEDAHFDLFKMLYGGCGACPHHDGCGSAELDDASPAGSAQN